MKRLLLLFSTLCWAYALPAQVYPTLGKVVRLDPALEAILPANATIEVLASGFQWTEGPVWVAKGGYLLFSDTKQNTIFKWHPTEGLSTFLKPAGYTGTGSYGDEPGSNGLILNSKGELVACEHGDRRLSVMPLSGGGKRTLADQWEGKRLNSPNDVCQHSSGAYYFTDPPYGLPQKEKDKTREIEAFGVYRLDPTGTVSQVISDLKRPNGVALSPDEKTLYIGQSEDTQPYVMAYPMQPDGSLGKGRIFYDLTPLNRQGLSRAPDGLCTDVRGNVYTTGGGGLVILSPQGKLLGRLELSAATSNCSFSPDGYLYITAENYLCRIKTLTKER